ncbi:hypothetical protein SAMN05446635_0262 [Burkholderia sp. OK233]|nr:hypothetical protein SAMN05446635_0262 [Burkholderia sp. OK233]
MKMKLLFPCSATTLACSRASMMVAACRIGDGIKGPTDAVDYRVSCQLHGSTALSVAPDRLG